MSAEPPVAEEPEVRAAGGIVHRPRRSGPEGTLATEIALVHRPRYDDWSFPKGKRDGDESDEQTALREVHEETGLRCRLGPEIGETRYVDNKGRQKVVRYWLMEPEPGPGAFVPDQEVDDVRWLPPDDAGRLLTYEHDRDLLGALRFDTGGKEGSSARVRGAAREGG